MIPFKLGNSKSHKQECIPVECVPPARNRTVGGLPDKDLPPHPETHPRQRPPWTETPPSVNRITDRCKKHYLAKTSLWAVKIAFALVGNSVYLVGLKPFSGENLPHDKVTFNPAMLDWKLFQVEKKHRKVKKLEF